MLIASAGFAAGNDKRRYTRVCVHRHALPRKRFSAHNELWPRLRKHHSTNGHRAVFFDEGCDFFRVDVRRTGVDDECAGCAEHDGYATDTGLIFHAPSAARAILHK